MKESIEHFEEVLGDKNEARKAAAREYMKYYLDYDEEELKITEITDTKMATSGDILYIAFKNANHVRDLHFRRAASCNDDLRIRDYIPPQLHARYMTIARKATERRAEDPKLKTQIRWGDNDIEIFVKEKGTDAQLKKQNLRELHGGNGPTRN